MILLYWQIFYPFIRAISATFYNCLHWSRSRGPCVKYGKSGGVTNSTNVGGSRWSWLWRLFYSRRKGQSQEDEYPRDDQFLVRRNGVENILDAALWGVARMAFLTGVFGRFWWWETRVLILVWVRIWPLQKVNIHNNIHETILEPAFPHSLQSLFQKMIYLEFLGSWWYWEPLEEFRTWKVASTSLPRSTEDALTTRGVVILEDRISPLPSFS